MFNNALVIHHEEVRLVGCFENTSIEYCVTVTAQRIHLNMFKVNLSMKLAIQLVNIYISVVLICHHAEENFLLF